MAGLQEPQWAVMHDYENPRIQRPLSKPLMQIRQIDFLQNHLESNELVTKK